MVRGSSGGFTVSGLPIGVSCWLPLVVLSIGDYTMRKLQMIPPEGSVQSLGAGPAGLKAPAVELSLDSFKMSSDLHMCFKVCMHVSCVRVHIQPSK